ncbi:lipase 3-like isoform X2 [Anoplolepis gracilipes]|uniref:lipase 3-like isoform X2 n=1 Tax=Anoplolepis gracilipes TaxID=354296 RepID=UPI003BA3D232
MTMMLLLTLLFSILAFVKAMPNLLEFNQFDDSSRIHWISAVKELMHQFSSSIDPNEKLTTLEIVNKYGYNGQLHKVTTFDGYILELHRLIGRTNSSDLQVQKPVVFLMAGILCSSACWVITGPEKGLAYILSDAGYDVWLGNARGTTYSRTHMYFTVDDKEFWDFSWHEIGTRDLPVMIDYILKTTDQQKLFYLGHSQGTTNFFVMTTEMPEYQNKIQAMFAMAPVAYCGRMPSLLMRFFSSFRNSVMMLMNIFGVYEFKPTSKWMKYFAQLVCAEDAMTQPLCSNLLFLIVGYNTEQFNKTLLPIIWEHVPAGVSIKQIVHFAQLIKSGKFRQYDHGLFFNKIKYSSFNPPSYDLTKIHVPVLLHYSSNDLFVNVMDVNQLYAELGNPCGKFRVPHNKFTHTDFMWANDNDDNEMD